MRRDILGQRIITSDGIAVFEQAWELLGAAYAGPDPSVFPCMYRGKDAWLTVHADGTTELHPRLDAGSETLAKGFGLPEGISSCPRGACNYPIISGGTP